MPDPIIQTRKPTAAFVGASWFALVVALGTYVVALWRMPLTYDQRWFYGTVLAFGLFGVIAVVKSVRDKEDDIAITPQFYFLSWVAALGPLIAFAIYLLNAPQDELTRGFLFLSYMFAVFAAVVVQRNVRDLADWNAANPKPRTAEPGPAAVPPAPPVG